jgi:DMSO/TMAO reductase YedYZ molybdopterin-dependent catalytic subunit
VSVISRGFHGRRRGDERLPPGQYLERGFPVLSAGPTPRVQTGTWQFTITTETGDKRSWNWQQLMSLPQVDVATDIHCVTKWSKLDTHWRGVSLDTLLEGVQTNAGYVMARSYGGYTTNLPLPDIRDGKAWIVYEYEGEPLHPEHGGPARMLVPHLYFWKSAKWVTGLDLMVHDKHGFWEDLGYHDYGDPWREQRYQGD